MPRYYIDVRSMFGVDEDLDGVDVPDVAAARVEALKLAEGLHIRLTGARPEACNQVVIEVVDEAYRTVLMIPYADLVERPLSPPD
ncbi:MAG TPA: hypothetical protein VK434_10250 [Microvirga sp.]|jgi:hypothetical protein|nr:hypothetical protein [Microvirga sp.]